MNTALADNRSVASSAVPAVRESGQSLASLRKAEATLPGEVRADPVFDDKVPQTFQVKRGADSDACWAGKRRWGMTLAVAKQQDTALLSIGALSRATGIPVETLRTWEQRYGFPLPERKPSGHRVYPVTSVPRLRRIAEALTHGHRAREAVTASEHALSSLLAMGPVESVAHPKSAEPAVAEVTELLRLVETFNARKLTQRILADWKRLEPLAFLQTRIAPLIHAVGEEWAAARLEIRHEHFLSERVGDILRSLRLPFEEKAKGPLVVCASLPSEEHGLGLQMVALLLAVAGCRILFLGTEVPPTQIASLARDLTARAVAVSVSVANRGEPMAGQLAFLRSLLPRRVTLVVGGTGAPGSQPGLKIFQDLGEVAEWGRQLMGETEKR